MSYRHRGTLAPIEAVHVTADAKAAVKALVGEGTELREDAYGFYITNLARELDSRFVPFGYWAVKPRDEATCFVTPQIFWLHFEEGMSR